MNGPLRWYGGKQHLANWIHSLEPVSYTHRNIVFGGGLGEFWNWRCEGISEAVNDANGDLTNLYCVLRTPDLYKDFVRVISLTPFSDASFTRIFDYGPQLSRAIQFFIRIRQSRQGLGRSYATPTTRIRRGMNENVSAWLSAVDGLQECHERLRRVEIRNMDFGDFIGAYDHANALFYCDPPYCHDTRSTTGEYGQHEMTPEDHGRLLNALSGIKGKFMLSGYMNEFYLTMEKYAGWKRHEKLVDNHASSAKVKERKVECCWCNY